MIHGNAEIVRFCTEATRGELPVSPTWKQVDLHGVGFRAKEMRGRFEGFFSSTFPQLTRVIKTGKTFDGQMVTPIFAATAQTFMEPGYKRTNGVLDSFGFQHKKGSVEEVGYLGCVIDSMEIAFGANDDPVIVSHAMKILKNDTTVTGITAGTYPSGTPFMGHLTTVTIDGADFDNLDGKIICENNLDVKGPGADGFALAIKEGVQRWGVQLRDSQEGNDRLAELRGSSTVAVVITIKTGVGTEAVSFTMPDVHIIEAEEDASEIGKDTEEPVTGVAQKPSGVDACAVAYVTT